MGRHVRRVYAVQLNSTPITVKYWQENVEVIIDDATDFLAALKINLNLPN
jgi:hypothetical protein